MREGPSDIVIVLSCVEFLRCDSYNDEPKVIDALGCFPRKRRKEQHCIELEELSLFQHPFSIIYQQKICQKLRN